MPLSVVYRKMEIPKKYLQSDPWTLEHATCYILKDVTCRRLMAAEASEISLNVTKAWPLNFGALEIMISST